MAKYCSRDCQLAHWSRHKADCKKRAAELFDEELFKEHPERDECPICMDKLHANHAEVAFKECCGKFQCHGCIFAQHKQEVKNGKEDDEKGICPFCRTPETKSDKEYMRRLEKCVNQAYAMYLMAEYYEKMEENLTKAMELYLKAGELGCAEAYFNLGIIYDVGNGVERNQKKARHYHELAILRGDVCARYSLGCMDVDTGDFVRASKHFMVGAKAGHDQCMKMVKEYVDNSLITNDEYAATFRSYQKQKGIFVSDE